MDPAYVHIKKESNDYFDDQIVTNFGITQTATGDFVGEYREKVFKNLEKDVFEFHIAHN